MIRKIAVAPDVPIHHSKKDTKKWCKGKVGVWHDYDLVEAQVSPEGTVPHFGQRGYAVLNFKCLLCGRENYQALIR